jgi:8-oxo-dGTP pyrophosphatase MutT (NUDIX family)
MQASADEEISKVQTLCEALRAFARVHDPDVVDDFVRLANEAGAFARTSLAAHFTASAWLVSADGAHALLMHHAKLARWLQPGGHADGDANLAAVALREAGEETGLAGLEVSPAIFDLDRHRIPARGQEPAHWHYDVRYVVRALGGESFVANEESLALAWVPVRTIASGNDHDPSLRRMARRWLQHQAS